MRILRRELRLLVPALLLALAVLWAGGPGAQAQVPIGDKPRLTQEGQAKAQTEEARQSSKRWLRYEEGVTCGVFRNPARTPADAMQRTEIANLIRREARAAGVREEFALSVAMQESRFSQNVRSCAGAIGVMQLMPGTAKQLGVDPYDLQDNVRGGVKYLKQMLYEFDGDETLAAAAYNSGPNRASLRAGRVPNIPETQTYVREIFGRWEPQFKVLVGSELGPSLAGANQNLVATARSASGSVGATQALAGSRATAISREGALAGGQERVQDAWEDNAQARVIVAQGFNRAIDQGSTISSLLVAQLIHELAQTSQTARSMTYRTSSGASQTPTTIFVAPPATSQPNPCQPVTGLAGTTCDTVPRTTDQTANVQSYLTAVQAAATSPQSAPPEPAGNPAANR
jgi:hypothetical protein